MAWGIFRPFVWLSNQLSKSFNYIGEHGPEIIQGLGIVAAFTAKYIPKDLIRNLVEQVGIVAIDGSISGQEKMSLVLASARLAADKAGVPFDEQKYRALIEILVAQLKKDD